MSAKFETSFPAPEWVHASDLTAFALSPAHYAERVRVDTCTRCFGDGIGPAIPENADKIEVDRCFRCDGSGIEPKPHRDSPAMLFGRVVHVMILGFGKFVVWKGGRKQGKAWDIFAEENKGVDIIGTAEEERAKLVAEAIRSNPVVREHNLLDGEMEKEYEWELGGRKCAGRLDIHTQKRIVDLKTSALAQPRWFTHHGIKLSYHAKKAWYVDGMRARGIPIDTSILIAAETKAPYPVTVFKLTENALNEGRRQYRSWLEQLNVCEATGEFPAYAQSIVDFDVAQDVELIFSADDDEGEAAA